MCWCTPTKRTPWCDGCKTVRPDLALKPHATVSVTAFDNVREALNALADAEWAELCREIGAPEGTPRLKPKETPMAVVPQWPEVPQWQCHKKVLADKIVDTRVERGDMTWTLRCGARISVTPELEKRHKMTEDDLGYYVHYGDGYESWSPTKAFEEGYTRIS